MTLRERGIFEDALYQNGKDLQLMVAIEEMSELQKEICKNIRGQLNEDHIFEEMADVYIMLDQLRIIFCEDGEVAEWRTKKVHRLKERIDKGW